MADFFDPRTLALLGAGAGFLDPNGGMMGGFQGAMQGYQSGLMAQDRKMQQQMIAHKLQRQMDVENTLRSLSQDGNNSDPIALGGALVRSGIPELIKQGTELLKTKQAKSFLKGVDQNGNPTFYTGYSTGEVSPTGVTPAEKLAFQNLGNQTIGVDPYTGKPKTSYAQGITPGQAASLGQSAYQFGLSHDLARQNLLLNQQKAALDYSPDFQAQKAASKQQALNTVQAKKDLPLVIDKANETIQLVDSLLKHPGFSISVGGTAPAGKIASMIPGTAASDFARRMEQIGGQQFLQAFETLKGGGQITEIEGTKATQAIGRMNTAQSEDEFRTAANEFKSIISKGVERARKAAGMQQPQYSDGWGDLK